MFGLQSVRSFFIACTADNESLYSAMLLRLITLSLFSKTHNKASFTAVSSAVKIDILSVNLTPHLKSNSGILSWSYSKFRLLYSLFLVCFLI